MSEHKAAARGMLKLGVILALYSTVACVGLAFIYTGTEKVIAQRLQADEVAALKELFPDADSFQPITGIKSPDPELMVTIEEGGAFAVMKNGTATGVILRTSRAGYSGPIKILVGVNANGTIKGIKILENTDTPGLGLNAGSSSYYVDRPRGIRFYDQFRGKSVGDPFIPKEDVIAITAATITSRSVAESVKAAGEAAAAWFADGSVVQGGNQ